MIRVNRQVDPKIRIHKQRRRQKALTVLLQRRLRIKGLDTLLRQNRIKPRRQRAVVKPHRIEVTLRLQNVNRMAVERRLARHQRRQITREPQPLAVEPDEKNFLILIPAPLQRRDHRLRQPEWRRQPRPRIRINLQTHFSLFTGRNLLP